MIRSYGFVLLSFVPALGCLFGGSPDLATIESWGRIKVPATATQGEMYGEAGIDTMVRLSFSLPKGDAEELAQSMGCKLEDIQAPTDNPHGGTSQGATPWWRPDAPAGALG